MGLGNKVTKFDFDANDLAAADDSSDGDSIDEVNAFGSVICSICIETVTKEGDRAWAKLHCGHEFHLDCIGSAFNTKGVMQCPNCRKIEKGQWLYSNGCRSTPEFSAEEWVHEEDIYDIGSYSEMAFGVHWCPFGSSARIPSFEDGDFSPSSYQELLGQHGYFTEPAAPTAGHPCPYVTYFGPVHSSSSSTGVSDSSSFPSHWNTGSSEVPPPYGFPVDPHYHGWDYHHSPPPPPQHFSASVPHVGSPPPAAARTTRANVSDVIRPRPPHFMRPSSYHGHSGNGRAGSSVASIPRSPPFPGSNARTRDRMQALQAYHQQSSAQSHQHPDSSPIISHGPVLSSGRRPSRGSLMGGSTSSSSDQAGGSSAFIRFNIWEREPYMQLQPAYPVNQMDREPSLWTFNEGSGSLHQRHGHGGSS